MPIRQLPHTLANQIAAGEVVERPASVVKELAENALDAGATMLRIDITDAGLTKLVITDNGHGIPQHELPLAMSRHATSKIASTEDLFNIHTFGFRGEALPSIASVSRFTLTSRPPHAAEAWQITQDGELKPAAHPPGTRVEVADIFYATPARRKFLKSPRAESRAIEGVVKTLALAHPGLTLTLVEDGAESWHIPAAQGDFFTAMRPRLAAVMGQGFAAQALPVEAQRPEEGAAIHGFVSPPTLHTGTAAQQYLFVNGRPVKDRQLQTALKNAYTDALPRGRHPFAVLFLTLPPQEVDVNVHPAKAEVRFRHGQNLYGLVYAAVRQTLSQTRAPVGAAAPRPTAMPMASTLQASLGLQAPPQKLLKGAEPSTPPTPHSVQPTPTANGHTPAEQAFLGAAIGQVANTYIVAETAEGSMVVVDQHAAHERLVYENLKQQFAQGRITAQPLLMPAVVSLTPADAKLLLAHAAELEKFGLEVESYSPTAVAVTALPQLLGDANPARLVEDVLNDLSDMSPRTTLHQRVEHVLATIACHHSIRAHRRLSVEEQNALLRQMEATPGSLTCNHGRPTTVTISLPELEKLFARR